MKTGQPLESIVYGLILLLSLVIWLLVAVAPATFLQANPVYQAF